MSFVLYREDNPDEGVMVLATDGEEATERAMDYMASTDRDTGIYYLDERCHGDDELADSMDADGPYHTVRVREFRVLREAGYISSHKPGELSDG